MISEGHKPRGSLRLEAAHWIGGPVTW